MCYHCTVDYPRASSRLQHGADGLKSHPIAGLIMNTHFQPTPYTVSGGQGHINKEPQPFLSECREMSSDQPESCRERRIHHVYDRPGKMGRWNAHGPTPSGSHSWTICATISLKSSSIRPSRFQWKT